MKHFFTCLFIVSLLVAGSAYANEEITRDEAAAHCKKEMWPAWTRGVPEKDKKVPNIIVILSLGARQLLENGWGHHSKWCRKRPYLAA
jgi:hypothetical protein